LPLSASLSSAVLKERGFSNASVVERKKSTAPVATEAALYVELSAENSCVAGPGATKKLALGPICICR
jgi:hypothetical protein